MIEIVDNLIPQKYLKDIQDYFFSPNAPWTFMQSMTYGEKEDPQSFGFGMSICNNGMFDNTYHATLLKGLLYTILEKSGKDSIFRSRVDMTLYNPNNYKHDVHVDLPMDNITTIFYMNSSDGNTMIYDNSQNLLKEIEPIENRLLIFDGMLPHTGHSPSNHKSRILINTNCI